MATTRPISVAQTDNRVVKANCYVHYDLQLLVLKKTRTSYQLICITQYVVTIVPQKLAPFHAVITFYKSYICNRAVLLCFGPL